MDRIIKKGWHYSLPFTFGLHWKKTKEDKVVWFDNSCRYIIHPEDQLDWNKLFGWSYGLHHKDSIRVVWRYNPLIDKIELSLYQYTEGKRLMYPTLCNVDINEPTPIKLEVINNIPTLIVACRDEVKIQQGMEVKPTWGYTLGTYFGGNQVAPHDVKVWVI
jgi:hypothetical protein